jgi:hypothetical protein
MLMANETLVRTRTGRKVHMALGGFSVTRCGIRHAAKVHAYTLTRYTEVCENCLGLSGQIALGVSAFITWGCKVSAE